ncbi:hypothetical protein DL766_001675 [Monosporascus sp. MC13-8B]|uniref:Carrier domain-containing protein n=1 Tax=Monosporascus cannonballus TaxID=155416 RepID=A0ABY0H966_9PEZI|nr:hypothetical protein DL762_005442 [Monosporascus cannonballus]RYO91902.1 hypothetical protein DL763_004840 [Monosporascus cannonballus]RYP37101.1 hypothetical protein DL766_001675 [Monosporascus sp. MC13-8B]
MSMVLRDRMFEDLSVEDWEAANRPKVQGTWNLHNVGQANYASANTFLDAFAQYRASLDLPCTAIDLGAMEGIGYLADNQELLRKMQGTGWRPVGEIELLEALNLAMMLPSSRKQQRGQGKGTALGGETFLLGLAPNVPLSSPDSSARLRKDVRMAIYHNIGGGGSEAASANDGLRSFLAAVKKDPSLLGSQESMALLAAEVGKKLAGLLLSGDADMDITMSTSDLGLDSLVAVELRGWWKLTFGFEISTLEMMSMGTLEALGKRVAEGLKAMYDL